MKILADILGISGIFVAVVLYQQKKRESMLIYKMILDIIWALHYCCIGAFSGAAVAVIAALREIVFVKRDIFVNIFLYMRVKCNKSRFDLNLLLFYHNPDVCSR